MFIDEAFYVNFADGSAKPPVDSPLIYRYGSKVGDPAMRALGLFGYRNKSTIFNNRHIFFIFRKLAGIFTADEMANGMLPDSPYMLDGWLDRIQVMTARENPSGAEGLFVAVKGGHNDESRFRLEKNSCFHRSKWGFVVKCR